MSKFGKRNLKTGKTIEKPTVDAFGHEYHGAVNRRPMPNNREYFVVWQGNKPPDMESLKQELNVHLASGQVDEYADPTPVDFDE